LIRGDILTSLNPVPKSIFDFRSINGYQNSVHVSKKLCIVILMETSEFMLTVREQVKIADC
jgi:hypothetical protein